jgi:hypothetical protein
MIEPFPLTDFQRETVSRSTFHRACVEHFGFLVTEHGYRMMFGGTGQHGRLVSFVDEHDIKTETFSVRIIFWLDGNSIDCKIMRFAGLDHQVQLSLDQACQRLGIFCPEELARSETIDPVSAAVSERIARLGAFVRTHLATLRSIPL